MNYKKILNDLAAVPLLVQQLLFCIRGKGNCTVNTYYIGERKIKRRSYDDGK